MEEGCSGEGGGGDYGPVLGGCCCVGGEGVVGGGVGEDVGEVGEERWVWDCAGCIGGGMVFVEGAVADVNYWGGGC